MLTILKLCKTFYTVKVRPNKSLPHTKGLQDDSNFSLSGVQSGIQGYTPLATSKYGHDIQNVLLLLTYNNPFSQNQLFPILFDSIS